MTTKLLLLRFFFSAFAIVLLPLSSRAEIDKKYFKKIADKVWATELPGFDPKVELTDSIFQGQSACFIARYVGLDADYNNFINPKKQALFTNPNSNLTIATLLRRNMVKINDASAAEYFTEFSIDPDVKDIYKGIKFVERREVFGAKIYKPDGTVRDVDISEALTVKGGKQNEDVEYKIAIPGLEAGDILDYFFHVDYYFEEHSIPKVLVNILAKYPTKLFTLDVRVDPRLSMEYGAFNDAPRISTFTRNDKGQNVFFLQLNDVYSLDEVLPYFAAARQMPQYLIHVNNTTAGLEYIPKDFRPGGMRVANPAFVLRDIAHAIADEKPHEKVLSEANSALKNWIKQHPDATPQQIADAAWIAARYGFLKSKESISDRQFIKTFYKLLEKQDQYTEARIGVVNPRTKHEITQISDFRDASYFIKIGDRYYLDPFEWTAIGGEIPSDYDGENCIFYTGRPDNPQLFKTVDYGKIPTSKAIDNVMKLVTTASVDPENPDDINVATNFTCKGAFKTHMQPVLNIGNVINSYSNFFGLKPEKLKITIDAEDLQEETQKDAEEAMKAYWGSDDARLDSFAIVKAGLTPDEPEAIVDFKGSVPGLITQAGNNLMVNIGKLFGKQSQATGEQRRRDISIINHFPERIDNTIVFEIPDGYEIVSESLSDLSRSVTSPIGSFNTDVTAEGNTVKIRYIERYNRSILPAEYWDEMLKIIDAAHDFTNTSILLRPKN